MVAFTEQVADGAKWSTRDVPHAGAQHTAMLENRRQDLEQVMGLVPQHQRVAMLTRMVEAEILPRLAGNRRAGGRGDTAKAAPIVVTTQADTLELVRLLLSKDARDSATFLETLQQRGVTPAVLYLGIITEAARCLGTLWEEDRCHFAEVTIAMGRLQQVVRAVSPAFQASALSRAHADSILLFPTPGEQHSFGLIILSEFFLREGWHIVGASGSARNDPADVVRSTWVDVAGFSIGSSARVDGLAQCIRSVRAASVNTDLKVMIGGPLLVSRPGLMEEVGADASAADAPDAVRQARGLLSAGAATR